MVMVDHVKTDLKCLDEYDSLLSHCMHKFMLSATYPNCEGACLYYDTNLGEFIRSGKVSGHGFEKRHDEHKAKSNMANASSNFYFLYPSQHLQLKDTRQRKGTFEILEMYIAAGFDPTSDAAVTVSKNCHNGGILVMDNDDINRIKSSMPRIPVELHKFHTYLAYLMEFGYDLAIRPSVNVSENPGFETIAGLFESS